MVWMDLVALAVRATDAGNFPRNAWRKQLWRPTHALLPIPMLSAIRRALGRVSACISSIVTTRLTFAFPEHSAGLPQALYGRNSRAVGGFPLGRRCCGVVY